MPYQKKYLIKKSYQESKKGVLSKNLIKNLSKIPYQKKVPYQKKFLNKNPYQESKKGALSKNLTKSLKRVLYQESKQNTLSKTLSRI